MDEPAARDDAVPGSRDAGDAWPSVSVIVPSICRPEALAACLDSLVAQTRPPHEVLVVLPSDPGACDQVVGDRAGALAVRVLRGSEAGIVRAVNLGLAVASGEVVALLDDDATAPRHWVARIAAWFRNPRIGAVGGPHLPPGQRSEDRPVVARWDRLTWFGYSAGPRTDARIPTPQVAHFLGEANLAFRRAAVADIDRNLAGRDERFGDDVTMTVRRRGLWTVADPDLFVWHAHVRYAFDPDRLPSEAQTYAAAHNQTYLWLKHLPPWRRPWFLAFGFLIGDRSVKGAGALAAWAVKNAARPARAAGILRLAGPTFRGRVHGLRTYRASRRARGG